MNGPRPRLLVAVALPVMIAVSAIAAERSASNPTATPGEPVPTAIPDRRAADYVGQQVTIEGRVVATHESPLATVFAFAPNFAGFTATILAADRGRFPADITERVNDKVVRVTGVVTAYR